jgi:hypothetical protein
MKLISSIRKPDFEAWEINNMKIKVSFPFLSASAGLDIKIFLLMQHRKCCWKQWLAGFSAVCKTLGLPKS